MELLLFYSFRNLLIRRLTTFLTASGMALVVFVFASIVMLAEGLQKTLVETGSWSNVAVLRRSAGSEMQSGIAHSCTPSKLFLPNSEDGASAQKGIRHGLGETARGSDHYQALFAIGVLLFSMTFIVNLVADILVRGIHKR